ncbi:hypothetical protein ABZZ74_53445 [Streptomyces sp. NPDC006476]|uniref:hypothetical protein n=1 Tax=Streptomyces sp. NPDC006476 TaxID=3157175 RepID=UPI0033A4AD33
MVPPAGVSLVPSLLWTGTDPRCRHLVGKSPEVFVREAALKAADDPFLRALSKTRDRIPHLAEVFATQDSPAAEPAAEPAAGSWPDPAPMGSRDLRDSQHGHAA